jgi:hypothetical protein
MWRAIVLGHHFVPQRYLKGFQAPERPGWIWMYDKLTQTQKLLPIKQVAQAPGFYKEDVERELNEQVEQPGGDVIDRMCRGEPIDEMERRHLTYYLGTMIRRVPIARSRAAKAVPQVLSEAAQEAREWFEEASSTGRIDGVTSAARLAEVDAVERRLQQQPAQVIDAIETPWPFASMLIAIYSMWWRVLRCAGPSSFLTSDNPAFFFTGYGLGTPQSELILPLRSDLLLHCSWQRGREEGIQVAGQRLVRSLNRRTAAGAERFVFYHKGEDWVLKAAQNTEPQLDRIQW